MLTILRFLFSVIRPLSSDFCPLTYQLTAHRLLKYPAPCSGES